MRAYELQGGFGLDKLTLASRPEPVAGPGQALVKMRAWSLNYRDLLVTKGIYAPRLKMPFQLLSDGVGEVVAVGEGVTRVKAGDRVSGIFMQRWIEGSSAEAKHRSALGGDIPGVAADLVALSEEGLVHVPSHLTDEEAATLPCAAVTAWNALVSAGHMKAGDTILVQGTGGVSIFALQFARMFGARVIATSSSDEKLKRVTDMGACCTINYKTVPEWGAKAAELSGGRGVDHVVEVGGAGTLAESFRAVRPGGRISVIGILTSGTVNPLPVLMKAITLQGIFVGSRQMFEDMNAAISLNQMRPVVDKVFPFAELPKALEYMASGAHFGKIVLKA